MTLIGKHRLLAHLTMISGSVQSVDVEVAAATSCWHLTYTVTPAHQLLLPEHGFGRVDELWQSTCFELFVGAREGGYREFNFAPPGAWAIYDFTGRRMGMRRAETSEEPRLVDMRLEDNGRNYPQYYQLFVNLPQALCSIECPRASLSAVIEERDGTKSYWALAHPNADRPDFHDPACFTLELPSVA